MTKQLVLAPWIKTVGELLLWLAVYLIVSVLGGALILALAQSLERMGV